MAIQTKKYYKCDDYKPLNLDMMYEGNTPVLNNLDYDFKPTLEVDTSSLAQFDETNWEDFWKANNDNKIYLVHAKDNIPFHTVIFPSLLLANKDNYKLPDKTESVRKKIYRRSDVRAIEGEGINLGEYVYVFKDTGTLAD